jgi:hypothetical protein
MFNRSVVTYSIFGALLLFVVVSVSGCSTLKAGEAEDAGYLEDPDQMEERRDRFPFHKVWLKDYSEEYYDKFTEIMVAPVNTDHVLESDWVGGLTLASLQSVEEDIKQIAKYMHARFVYELYQSEKTGRKVVDKAGPETVILEMALVELVPTKAWLNAAGGAAGYFVPGAGTVAGLASSGSVAIEGRLRDAGTGEIVAMFKDREKDQSSPIGIQGYTWYAHSENNIDDWAKQFVEVLETGADDEVADSLPITHRPW